MEENIINDVDYSEFLSSLQSSNLDIYDKVNEILTYFQEKDKLEKEKEEKQLKEQEQENKSELEELEEQKDYNVLFHEELIKIESNTQYLESINNLLISMVLILGIILGVLSFNLIARFFKW